MDTVLITGCSTGLGLETALFLAERGFRVYATVRDLADEPAVHDAAEQRRVALRVLPLDVTDQESITAAVNTVIAEAGSIYSLVNNAGTGLRGCFEDVSDEEVRQVFDVNVFGTMAVTRQVLPHMRAAKRGRIVTITSVGGRIASFGLSGYCSSKFAQEGFGEALALEIAPFGLESILIEAGIIMTTHWTINRGTALNALSPTSAYRTMFRRHEAMADRIAQSTRNRPVHVAQTIHHALTAKRPRMRYVVGQPAGLVVSLRRHIPGELFERIYFGQLLRRLSRGDTLSSH